MNDELKNTLIKKLGIEGADPEKQNQMLDQIGTIVYQGALVKAMDEMSDDDVAEFEKLADSGATPEQVFTFINSRVSNFDQILGAEAESFMTHANNVMKNIG